MNTPSTTPPISQQSLDQFETALLGELKEHVATQPAREPVPERSHGGRRRWAAGIAAAAAAATAYVVVSPGGPAVSPAYAVDQQADGDVVVTVHRLEDSEGLERALAEHGIEADVSFAPPADENGFNTFELPGGEAEEAPEGEEGKSFNFEAEGEEPGASVDQAIPGQVPELPDCGANGAEPATLTHEGEDWVLRIPADSPAQDRPIVISTAADGGLMVAFEGNEPNSYCAFMSVGENG